MTTPDEIEPVDGVTVGKTRRVVFTALAVVAFAVAVQSAYEESLGYWQSQPTFAVLQNALDEIYFPSNEKDVSTPMRPGMFWTNILWLVACLGSVPILFLVVASHNSPLKAIRDFRLLASGASVILVSIWAALLGDHNAMPVWTNKEWAFLWRLHGSEQGARESLRVSPLWLLIPTTLTIAFIIVGARRRAVRDAELAADEGE